MVKKSDRMFHLSIAAFAVILAAVSIGTILVVKNPFLLRKLSAVHPVNWFNAQFGQTNSNNSSTSMIKRAPVAVNSSVPVSSQPDSDTNPTSPSNDDFVSVRWYGSHVSTHSVQTVTRLLNNYHIVDSVSNGLHMNLHTMVHIYLVGNQTDYATELSSLGVSADEVKTMTMDTGGFTQASTIMIPLYQNRYTYDLANTLAHELTHAFLNQNIDDFPSWMNEGLAVSNGMAVQAEVENPVAFAGYARQMTESVLSAAVSGTLVPLSDDESKILQQNIPYDLELQDWLAMRDLVLTRGEASLQNYFRDIHSGDTIPAAFTRAFGISEDMFNQQLTHELVAFEEQQDNGASVQFQFQNDFQGYVQILQHGMQVWRGFLPEKGTNSVGILPSGIILTDAKQTPPDFDSTPPDETTLYVNLIPSQPFEYQGQLVNDCGFAIDYHDGLYGFVNSWITLKDGRTIYLDTPSLFGTSVVSVKETKANSFLLNLINPGYGL